MARLDRLALPTFALLAAVLVPSRALAEQECSTDADCAAGYACIKGFGSPGCEDPSAGCPPPEPVESDIGWCEPKPISCASDADCPDFMRCMDEETVCWVSSTGETGCTPPDPAKRTCQATAIECSTTSDCPASFECQSVPAPCPMYDCAPGTDCIPPECNETMNVCQPKQIACATNADCPSAWSCEEIGSTVCEGSTSGMGGSTTSCTTTTNLVCQPTGFSSSSGGSPENTAGATPKSGSGSSGGCAMRSPARSGDGLALVAIAGAALLLARRRRD